MDRLRAIEVFTEVARGRSFTAAALRLGMAKGNVTKHVKWLEELLGAQLLTRTTKSVSPTEAGLTLLDGGQRGAVNGPKGIIRIGAPPSFAAVHLVPLITAFSALHPDLQFVMHLDDGRMDIAGEGLDLSLRIAPSLKDTSLVAQKLGSVPQLLVAAQSYLAARGQPKTPEDLAAHNCLVHALKAPTNFWTFDACQLWRTAEARRDSRAWHRDASELHGGARHQRRAAQNRAPRLLAHRPRHLRDVSQSTQHARPGTPVSGVS